MVLTIRQAQIPKNQFNDLFINQQVQMASPVVNCVLSPFEGNTNTGDSQGRKLYLQATKEIDKEADKLDISVSNAKDIIDYFFSLNNTYGWGHLEFMVETGAGTNHFFRQVEKIQISDLHHQSHG